jgi:hypothetical protein
MRWLVIPEQGDMAAHRHYCEQHWPNQEHVLWQVNGQNCMFVHESHATQMDQHFRKNLTRDQII